MQLSVKSDIDKVIKHLNYLEKKAIPQAAESALNATAWKVKQGVDASTKGYIDRPKPFTQRPTAYRKATRRNLRAVVYVKPKQLAYLNYIIEGRAEHNVAVPTKARRNAYGNLARGYVKNRKTKPKFFSGTPKGGNRPAGLYERTNRNKKLKQHAVYKDMIGHSRRWPFYRIARSIVDRHFVKIMNKELAYAISKQK